MKKIERLHSQAMKLADQAELLRLRGKSQAASQKLEKAFQLEKEAALIAVREFDEEPTRSVLLRSAASFALECRQLREAEQLISYGLSGNPPEEVANELRDLLEQAHFERHLALRGIELSPNEFQLSMAGGSSVGLGYAKSDTLGDRIDSLEKIIFRTAERLLEKPYRDRGRKEHDIKDRVEVFISAPRAASFAVTFRLGQSAQTELPGMSFAESVLDELLDTLELFDRGESKELTRKIPDHAYLRNFVGLAKKIAPDGDSVRMVGFTAQRPSGPRSLALSTASEELEETAAELLQSAEEVSAEKDGKAKREFVELEGRLLFADERNEDQSAIKIISDSGKSYTIHVPVGMMADIVSPHWERKVHVKALKRGKELTLESIRDVREP